MADTATCANCKNAPDWVHDDPGALPVNYCDSCLPWFLRPRAVDGSLTKYVAPKPAKKAAAPAPDPEPESE